jgi:alginate O-acetyltransferase complex protein AlgJ
MSLDRRTELANSVLVGRDGWLFHRSDFVFEQMSGVMSLTDEDLRAWVGLLTEKLRWLNDRKIEFCFLIAPEKHVVYRDYLPEGILISEERPVKRLIRELMAVAPIEPIYPCLDLVAERVNRDTYHAVGSHWNFFGGFIAYRALAREIAKRTTIPIVDFGELATLPDRVHAADLGVRLDPELVSPEHRCGVSFAKSKMIFENGIYGRGHLAVYENLNAALPKAVMFRDSSSYWILPFLSESFSRIVAAASPHIYNELIEHEKPDVVILELIERWVSTAGTSPVFLPQSSFQEISKMSIDEVASKSGLALGWVDIPAPKSEVGAALDVAGWVISAEEVQSVGIYLDGSLLGNAELGPSRADLNPFPCPQATTGAFRFQFDVRAARIPPGRHRLHVRASLRPGKECVISEWAIKTV